MFLEYEVGDTEDEAQELCHIRTYVLPVLNSTCGGIKRFLKQGMTWLTLNLVRSSRSIL